MTAPGRTAVVAASGLLLAAAAIAIVHGGMAGGSFAALSTFWQGTLASFVAGMATGLGSIVVLLARRPSEATVDAMLGFAGGVMLAATFFSLLMPALELVRGGQARVVGVLGVGAALMAGAATVLLVDRLMPHEHFVKGVEGGRGSPVRRIWLFVSAIAIHNFPEGMATGVAFGGGDVLAGVKVAMGIGLQNVPEGLAVSVALLGVGYSKWRATAFGVLTGVVEPIGGALGAGTVALASMILPWALAFAGGAMLFVISHEIIPETHRKGHETRATAGLVVGFVAMMVFDTLFA